MNCASTTMPASRSNWIARLLSATFGLLVEAVELQLRGGLGAERHVDQAGLAIERKKFLVAQDVGHARVDAPLHLVGQAAGDQFLAELHEFLAIDRRLLVRQDEEAHVIAFVERLDFVDHLLGIAHAIVAPELPLRTERAGERAAARHIGDRDPAIERNVFIFAPLQDAPVRVDRIEVLDGRRGLGRHDLGALGGRSVKAMPLIVWRVWAHSPDSMARTTSMRISSPSPRTIASIQGASVSTC